MNTNDASGSVTSAASRVASVPGIVNEHAQAVSDTLALGRWVAALVLGVLVLGILVGLAAARAALPVYIQGG